MMFEKYHMEGSRIIIVLQICRIVIQVRQRFLSTLEAAA